MLGEGKVPPQHAVVGTRPQALPARVRGVWLLVTFGQLLCSSDGAPGQAGSREELKLCL